MLKNVAFLVPFILFQTGCVVNQENTYPSPAYDSPNVAYLKQTEDILPTLGKAFIKPFLMQPNYTVTVETIDGLRYGGERIKSGRHVVTLECMLDTANHSCGTNKVSFYAKPNHTYRPQLPPISGWNLNMRLGENATIVEVK